ncbi:hypothetical protein EYF80_039095 [Liparis tanakae]|uniref:Uncharacterized protein n=1 Tax=Liparis tanakae TaxID=230148 RepID=A0A4Z2GAR7_9TELE|nr:hypothetical protein EYF80_039095 [Liparis tanakae]
MNIVSSLGGSLPSCPRRARRVGASLRRVSGLLVLYHHVPLYHRAANCLEQLSAQNDRSEK